MVELTAEIADGWIPMGFRPGMLESHYAARSMRGSRAVGGAACEASRSRRR